MASERPKKLGKAELDQYNVMLEEQAFPFEEKATELHELNAHRAASGVYDKWVQEQLRRAARAAPGPLRQDRESAKGSSMRSAEPPTAARRSGAAACSAARRLLDRRRRLQCRSRRRHAGQRRRLRRRRRPPRPPPTRSGRAAASELSAGQSGDAARLRRRQPGAAQRPGRRGRARATRRSRSPIRSSAGRTPTGSHLPPGRQANEAVAELELAVKLSPRQPIYLNQLGIAYRQQGQFAKAREAYETRARARLRATRRALLNLGILYDLYLR